jgi:uncharacterized protein
MLFDSKQTRLRKAILQGESAKIKSLLGKLAPDSTDSTGVTPLALAASLGQLSTVKLLLKAGAQVNLVSTGGETALMASSRHGQAPVMEVLIASGANVNAAGKRGDTALILATVWATRMASIGKPKTDTRVKLLLDAGANVNAADRKGRTAVMSQVRSGGGTLHEEDRLGVLRTLIEAGAEVDATGDRGRTPLMAAAFRGLKDTFNVLLEAGAKHTLRDNSSRNALMHAAEGAFWTYRKAGYIGIFHTLFDLGINLQEKDANGQTALMTAQRNHRKDLANMLKKAGAFE